MDSNLVGESFIMKDPYKLRSGDRFKLSPLGETFRVQHFGHTHVTTVNERTQKCKTVFFTDIPPQVYLLTEKIQ
jgi:hypothetical protein